MSAIKQDQLVIGTVVFMVDFGGTVVQGTVVSVKPRPGASAQVCIDLPAQLKIEEFCAERFFPTAREAWYAVAMFAQRRAQDSMAAAATAFKKAGIASDEIPEAQA